MVIGEKKSFDNSIFFVKCSIIKKKKAGNLLQCYCCIENIC
jgi:hypothetical protein